MFALGLAGCLSAPSGLPPSPEPSPAATPCTTTGTVLSDEQSLTTGDSGEEPFVLSQGCRLAFDFELRRLIGALNVSVEGPAGPVFEFAREGAAAGPVEVSRDTRTTYPDDPAPAGTYVYRYTASHVAEFRISARASQA